MLCPKCGTELGEGKAYCANPACGAVPGQQAPKVVRSVKITRNYDLKFKLDFVKLARLAAVIIAGLAFAYLFLGVKTVK